MCRYPPQTLTTTVAQNLSHRLVGGRFTSSGKYFVACTSDKPCQQFRIFDCTNRRRWKESYVIECDTGRETCVFAISPNEYYVAYNGSHADDCLRIGSVGSLYSNTAHERMNLRTDQDPRADLLERRANDIEFSADSSQLLIILPGSFRVYHMGCQGNEFSFFCKESVDHGCFADDTAQTILTGAENGRVSVWDTRSMDNRRPVPVVTFGKHKGHVQCVTSKGDGHYFLSAGSDDTVKLWDARRPGSTKSVSDFVRSYEDERRWGGCNSCGFSPPHSTGQGLVYCLSSMSQLLVYELHTGRCMVNEYCSPGSPVFELSWHPREMLLAATSYDSGISILEYQTPA